MQITVTTTPTRLDNPTMGTESIAVRDASEDIFIGGPNVTTGVDAETDGWPYKTADDPMLFRVPTDGLWAVTATTATVEILST